jgi:ubiquinone biosynthesis protein
MARGAQIAAVMCKHGLKELFGRSDELGAAGRRGQAKRLRAALEELGPTYSKLGQVLSTRPDLLPAEYIEELATLQDHVAPMAEEQVVQVAEQELGVPWEDVFDSIDPKPLAAGTTAQVHRATLASGERVVVKVQRPTARKTIEQDLALLEVFAEKLGERPALNQVIDMGGRVPTLVRRCAANSTFARRPKTSSGCVACSKATIVSQSPACTGSCPLPGF